MGQTISEVNNILDYKKAKKEAKNERQAILEQMAQDEKAKVNLVKKNLAAQRAKYGASGMSNDGVTEGAVLKRLQEETEEPYKEKRRNNLEKLSKIKVQKPNLLKSLIGHFDSLVG